MEPAASHPVTTHRCRLVEWRSSAVTALAANEATQQLAVGREDGSIEAWRLPTKQHSWRRTQWLPPVAPGHTVEALLWTRDGRLVSAGLSGLLLLWDLGALGDVQRVDSGGGAVWSLALSPDGAVVAAGCEDGCVRLFGYGKRVGGAAAEAAELSYKASMAKAPGRVLSLAWRPDGSALFGGGSDGTIRKFSRSTHTQHGKLLDAAPVLYYLT